MKKIKQTGSPLRNDTKKASAVAKNTSSPAVITKSSSATASQMPTNNKAQSRIAPPLPKKKSSNLKEQLLEQSGQSRLAIPGASTSTTTQLLANQFAVSPTSAKTSIPSETNAEASTITTSEVTDSEIITPADLDEEFRQGLIGLIKRTYPNDWRLVRGLEYVVKNIMENLKRDRAALVGIKQERLKSQYENEVKKEFLEKIKEEAKRLNAEGKYTDKKQKELAQREKEITEKEEKLKQMQANILVGIIKKGDNKELNNLITQGFDPNFYDQLGRTPLHAAVSANNLEAVNILLERGANPNLQDSLKRLPLHLAFLENEKYRPFANINEAIVIRLLAGTNALIKDKFGKLASDYLSAPDEPNNPLEAKYIEAKFRYLTQALITNRQEMELLENDTAEEIKATQTAATTAPVPSSSTTRPRSKSCTEKPVIPEMFSPTPRPLSLSSSATEPIQRTRSNK